MPKRSKQGNASQKKRKKVATLEVSPTLMRKCMVHMFQNAPDDKVHQYWNDLQGTGWEHDEETMRVALFRGVPLEEIPSLNARLLKKWFVPKEIPLQASKQENLQVLLCLPDRPEVYSIVRSEPNLKTFIEISDGESMFEDQIPTQCWHNLDFCLAWVRAGGLLRCKPIPETLLDCAELFLQFADSHTMYKVKKKLDFAKMSARLQSSMSFYQQLVKLTHAQHLTSIIDDDIMTDPDILLQAYAYSENIHFRDDTEMKMYGIVKDRLDDFYTFFKVILCDVKSETSTLHRLGGDSSIVRVIGSYLHIPVPPYFLQAATNMNLSVMEPFTMEKA